MCRNMAGELPDKFSPVTENMPTVTVDYAVPVYSPSTQTSQTRFTGDLDTSAEKAVEVQTAPASLIVKCEMQIPREGSGTTKKTEPVKYSIPFDLYITANVQC